MTQGNLQPGTGEGLLAPFDLIASTSESTRAKTAELLGARVRNPNTRKRLSGGMALIFGILFGTSART
jgi:hypothetical protein